MKKISNILSLIIAALTVMLGCESTTLDVVESPNALNPSQASVDFFLNQIQLMTAQIHSGEEGRAENGLSQFGMEPVRIQHGFGPTYRESYDPSDFDRVWDNVYARALIDIRTMNPLAEEAGQFTHIAIGQILEAYIMMSMVDFFGDVPYSEAAMGGEGILNPTVDPGASIYQAADQLLVDAIANLNKDETSLPSDDLFYNANEDQWKKVANTMRLKLYLQTRLASAEGFGASVSTSRINELIAGNQLILDPADDFFGEQRFAWACTALPACDGDTLLRINCGNLMGDPFAVVCFTHSKPVLSLCGSTTVPKYVVEEAKGTRAPWGSSRTSLPPGELIQRL